MKPVLFACWAVLTFGAPPAVLALAGAGIPLSLAVLAIVALASVIVSVAERLAPFEPKWNVDVGDARVDRLHALGTLVIIAAFVPLASRVPGLERWPAHWPFALQVALALVLAELGAYWVHRLMHTTRALWRVHLVHHSALRLHALNSSRNHPLDSLLVLVAAAAPLLVLGASAHVLAATGALALVHLQFQHVNATLELGPLNFIFAGPEPHRWHHSRVEVEANGNYGHVLSVWDGVFRTRVSPPGRPSANVGLFSKEPVPESFTTQLVVPFR
jgi:sterol desaturase/sphingolipid hydroxylase (fatty acid hydroxylase superfamily)